MADLKSVQNQKAYTVIALIKQPFRHFSVLSDTDRFKCFEENTSVLYLLSPLTVQAFPFKTKCLYGQNVVMD